MQHFRIFKDLHQFSTYVPPINLTFHQYLLLTDQPLLVHTGSLQQAEKLVSLLKEVLGDRVLTHIFISHFESDECGGLSLMLQHFPGARPVCSEITARQLTGFGITDDIIVKKPGETLAADGYELEFIGYPSEMHLWEGLLCMETRRGILFGSDLVIRFGESGGKVIEGNWENEVDCVDQVLIPDPARRERLQNDLLRLRPRFVAPGHGPCLKIAG